MGQNSSSQIEPSQIPSSAAQMESQSQPAPDRNKKRGLETAGEGEEARRTKKARTSNGTSGSPRAGRAVPQHMRGTSIRPSQVTRAESPQVVVERKQDDGVGGQTGGGAVGEASALNGMLQNVQSPEKTGHSKSNRRKNKDASVPEAVSDGVVPGHKPVNSQQADDETNPNTIVSPAKSKKKKFKAKSANLPAESQPKQNEPVPRNLAQLSEPSAQHIEPIAKVESKEMLDDVTQEQAAPKSKKKKKTKKSTAQINNEPEAIVEDQFNDLEAGGIGESSRKLKRNGKRKQEEELQAGAGADEVEAVEEPESKPPKRQKKSKAALIEPGKEGSTGRLSTRSQSQGVIDPNINPDGTVSLGDLELTGQEAPGPGSVKPKRRPRAKKKGPVKVEDDDPVQSELNAQWETEQTPKAPPKSKTPKSRTRKLRESKDANGDSEYEDEPRILTRTGPVNYGHQAWEDSRPTAIRAYQTADRGTIAGPWTSEERGLAHRLFNDYCTNNDISEAELKQKTTDWANMGPFKIELLEAFPRRHLTNIRKVCQRMFSPYEKGVWSGEETERLKDAYARYPEDWPQISKMCERSIASCVHHWKDIVMHGDTRQKGAWTVSDEAKLVEIVEELIKVVEKTTKERKKEVLETMINWDEVVKQLGGTRSAKRCKEKWALLKSRQSNPVKVENAEPASPEAEKKKGKNMKREWCERQYATMKPGDHLAALIELYSAVSKLASTDYHHEDTFWSVISENRDEDDVFNTPLLRYIYYKALETYDCKRVRKAEGYEPKLTALIKRLKKLGKKGEVELEERGYAEAAKHPWRPRGSTKKKSADLVEDDEEDDDEEQAPRKSDIADDVDVDAEPLSSDDERMQGTQKVEAEPEVEVPRPQSKRKKSVAKKSIPNDDVVDGDVEAEPTAEELEVESKAVEAKPKKSKKRMKKTFDPEPAPKDDDVSERNAVNGDAEAEAQDDTPKPKPSKPKKAKKAASPEQARKESNTSEEIVLNSSPPVPEFDTSSKPKFRQRKPKSDKTPKSAAKTTKFSKKSHLSEDLVVESDEEDEAEPQQPAPADAGNDEEVQVGAVNEQDIETEIEDENDAQAGAYDNAHEESEGTGETGEEIVVAGTQEDNDTEMPDIDDDDDDEEAGDNVIVAGTQEDDEEEDLRSLEDETPRLSSGKFMERIRLAPEAPSSSPAKKRKEKKERRNKKERKEKRDKKRKEGF